MGIQLAHKAAAAARHFGDLVRSKMLDDLVERARHSRKACEFLDQRITARNRFFGMDGLAVNHDGPGLQVAAFVRE